MPFMVPEIDNPEHGFYRVVTTAGGFLIPADLCEATLDAVSDYVEGEPQSVERVFGWFCRLTAPGYLDQTDWDGPYATEEEARTALSDAFDVCSECGEDMDETEGNRCAGCTGDSEDNHGS